MSELYWIVLFLIHLLNSLIICWAVYFNRRKRLTFLIKALLCEGKISLKNGWPNSSWQITIWNLLLHIDQRASHAWGYQECPIQGLAPNRTQKMQSSIADESKMCTFCNQSCLETLKQTLQLGRVGMSPSNHSGFQFKNTYQVTIYPFLFNTMTLLIHRS